MKEKTMYQQAIERAEACERAANRVFTHSGASPMFKLWTRNAVQLRMSAYTMTVEKAGQLCQ